MGAARAQAANGGQRSASLPVNVVDFHQAAVLRLDAARGTRAGDEMHLAYSERAGAISLVTLDSVMARNAQPVKLEVVPLGT